MWVWWEGEKKDMGVVGGRKKRLYHYSLLDISNQIKKNMIQDIMVILNITVDISLYSERANKIDAIQDNAITSNDISMMISRLIFITI